MSVESENGASRRDEAREKAKAIREQRRKQQRKARIIIASVIVAVIVGVAAGGYFFVLQGQRPTGPGPLNMRSDGIVIGGDFVAERTPATQVGQKPLATAIDDESDVIRIQMYVDYFCPVCNTFEQTNGEQIVKWLDTGVATVEIHPIPLLDRVSQGTKYSSRATNAAACVANYAPDQYYAFHTELFAQQPEESTVGLTDEQLIQVAKDAKVTAVSSVTTCITDQRVRTWVAESKERALTGPIADSDIAAISGTPTILVNGQQYTGAADDAQAFRQFVLQAAGTSFNESSTPTPTPTPEVPAG